MGILVIGSTNIDITAHVSRFPEKGETLLGSSISYANGGKGANQAVACGKTGSSTIFMTCVGNDTQGHDVVNSIADCGVDISHVKYSNNQKTGTAIINVDDNGDNNIVVIQGSNLECDVAYIEKNENLIKECDIVLLQLEIPFDAIEKAIEIAGKYEKTVILNPAPATDLLDKKCYKYITYMTPNETEVLLMAGCGVTTVDEAVNKLREYGIKNVLVTLGDKGSVLYKENEVIKVEACKVKAVDTVAAGDCYNGAFASALLNGMDEKSAMEFASSASAIAVTRYGAQDSIPTKDEINKFMNIKEGD